ncbi:MAG TPA: DUF1194 domain-containing protein [Acetobacteraceae bacterium]|nr:DUF1194 domain-containing protein [Acetobacteraceae bacterium]
MLRGAFLLVLAWTLASPAARAAVSADMALVLVSDVSRSIDDGEFRLQKDGYLAAFTDPRVVAAIRGGTAGAIAVSYVEFAGGEDVRAVLGWTMLRDAASARQFAERLNAAPRSFRGRTAISSGIDLGAAMLATSGIAAERRVIDVCGDGTNNSGRPVTEARDAALKSGITINGLAIINDHPVSWAHAHVQPPGGLAKYYREHVIGGPGAFVLEVRDFHSFGEAMTRKLVTEISGRGPPSRYAAAR